MSMADDVKQKMQQNQGLLDNRFGAPSGQTPIGEALKKRRLKTMTDKGIAPDQIDNGQPYQNQGQGDT